jgi:hypothetical protein
MGQAVIGVEGFPWLLLRQHDAGKKAKRRHGKKPGATPEKKNRAFAAKTPLPWHEADGEKKLKISSTHLHEVK